MEGGVLLNRREHAHTRQMRLLDLVSPEAQENGVLEIVGLLVLAEHIHTILVGENPSSVAESGVLKILSSKGGHMWREGVRTSISRAGGNSKDGLGITALHGFLDHA